MPHRGDNQPEAAGITRHLHGALWVVTNFVVYFGWWSEVEPFARSSWMSARPPEAPAAACPGAPSSLPPDLAEGRKVTSLQAALRDMDHP